jgi:hypothetical protein
VTEEQFWPMMVFFLSIIALTLAIDILLEPPSDDE